MTSIQLKKYQENLCLFQCYNLFQKQREELSYILKLLDLKLKEPKISEIEEFAQILTELLISKVERPLDKLFGEKRNKNLKEDKKIAAITFKAASFWVKKQKEISLDDIAYIYENTDYFFFLGLDIKSALIEKLIEEIEKGSYKKIIKRTRSLAHNQEDGFYQFVTKLYEETGSKEKIIEHIDQFTSGDYIELPPEICGILRIIYLKRNIDLLFKLIESLKYFPLQGSIMTMLWDPDLFIQLLKYLKNCKDSKILAYLMMDKFFRKMYTVSDNLTNNLSYKKLNEKEKKDILTKEEQWRDSYKSKIEKFVSEEIRLLGYEPIVRWYISLESQFRDKDEESSQRQFVMELENVINASTQEYIPDNPNELTLQELIFYSGNIKEEDQERSKLFSETICQKAYNQDYYPLYGNTDHCLGKFWNVCNILYTSGISGIELMKEYRPATEGYNVKRDSLYKTKRGDQFWLSVLTLMFELKKDVNYFNQLLSLILNLASQEDWKHTDNYLNPLFILELVVSQVNIQYKDNYEEYLLDNLPSIITVIRIFLANNGKLSERIKLKLQKRLEGELELEIQTYNNMLPEYIHFIKDYVKNYITLDF